ncbi:MAG: BtpA/SgcQ family protein [Myxococcota bacterium]
MIDAPRGLIGVLHVPAMPGDPRGARGAEGFAAARDFALRDAEAYRNGGVETLVVENFGSAPFGKGDASSRLPPHQVAALSLVARRLIDDGFTVGINCLRNDARSAVGIAAATGASFVRINVHTGAYVTDQGLIEGEAAATLRYRSELGAHVAIAADVLVKHAAPLVPIDAPIAAEEAFDRGLADAIIVSGTGTGAPVDEATLDGVLEGAAGRPVWIGSGLTIESAPHLSKKVTAAIVGTAAKKGGTLHNPVNAERVRALNDAFRTGT